MTQTHSIPATARGRAGAASNPDDPSINDCFARQVAQHPRDVAVQDELGACTYAELDDRANGIARALLDSPGVGTGAPVALLIDPGRSHVAAILGILRAGHPYLPLDTRQPASRQGQILDNSTAHVLLCDASHADRAAEVAGDRVTVIDVGVAGNGPPCPPAGVHVPASAPAYILYTSGSTGEPKGVQVNHRLVVHNARDLIASFGLRPGDRCASFLSPAHGLTASLTFQTLLSGGVLFPFDLRSRGLRALATWLQQERINLVKATPSVIRHLLGVLGPAEAFPDVRYLWLGGEPLYREDIERLWPVLGAGCRIISGFSSTETKNCCRLHIDRDTPLADRKISVGQPPEGKRIFLLDDGGREVAPGETGEIWVQSRFLADGYWRDPELTRSRFRPAAGDTDERMYRTGDLGRLRPDGMLELRGRRDQQLKIRGFRVQPEEAAAALREVRGVTESAVLVEDVGGEKRMAGYAVTDEPGLDDAELRRRLAQLVPDYLVPTRLAIVPHLPLTPIGKLDTAALRELAQRAPRPGAEQASLTEQVLLKAARAVVPGGRIGVVDDFFAAGGDSLGAATLLARVEHIFQVAVPLGDFVADPRLQALAARIDTGRANPGAASTDPGSLLLPLASSAGGAPLYLLPGGGGGEIELFLAYADLAAELGANHPVLGFRATRPDGRLAAGNDIGELVTAFLEALRSAQPHGPYALIGNCYGGLIAIEMAARLRDQGETASVVLLDTLAPGQLRARLRGPRRFLNRQQARVRQLARRARHHWRASRGVGPLDRAVYFLGKLGTAVKLVREANTPAFHPEHEVSRRIAAARDEYKHQLMKFRPREWAGPVALIVSDAYRAHGTIEAWRRLHAGALHVVTMSGDHGTQLRELAPETARHVLACLAHAGVPAAAGEVPG